MQWYLEEEEMDIDDDQTEQQLHQPQQPQQPQQQEQQQQLLPGQNQFVQPARLRRASVVQYRFLEAWLAQLEASAMRMLRRFNDHLHRQEPLPDDVLRSILVTNLSPLPAREQVRDLSLQFCSHSMFLV